MEGKLIGCCGGGDNYKLKLSANLSDANERRFIFKLASGQLEINGMENPEYVGKHGEAGSIEINFTMHSEGILD